MGNYILWDDVVGRYPKAETKGDSGELQESYIEGTEAFMDAILAKQYTVPVTGSPPLLKDIAIDLAYAKMAVNKDKGVPTIKEDAMKRLKMIMDGDVKLIDENGDEVSVTGEAVWSTTKDYESTHSMLGAEFDRTDPDLIEDLANERN